MARRSAVAGGTAVGFRATVVAIKSGGHYVIVPDTVAAAAGVALRDRVRGTAGGAPYRSSLARYSGQFHLGIHKAVLAEAGAGGGETIALTLERDPEPPPGEVIPADLAAAIAASPEAQAGVAAMGPAHRREHVKHVEDAKRPETRARRIVATVAALAAFAGEAARKRAARELDRAVRRTVTAKKAKAKKATAKAKAKERG